MNISNLPKGTKLMWESKGKNPVTNKPIIYPCTVGVKQKTFKWARIIFPNSRHWMGPEVEYLRKPTKEELDTLTWPEIEE